MKKLIIIIIKAQKIETRRKYIRIEKGGHYISDQTLLLTAKMVNSCKSKEIGRAHV